MARNTGGGTGASQNGCWLAFVARSGTVRGANVSRRARHASASSGRAESCKRKQEDGGMSNFFYGDSGLGGGLGNDSVW